MDKTISPEEYAKEQNRKAAEAISKMPPASEEQFIAQCERLWKPRGEKLKEIVVKHVNLDDSPDDKLIQIRSAVAAAYQNSLHQSRVDQIELMWELEHLMQRPGLTWEDVERKSLIY